MCTASAPAAPFPETGFPGFDRIRNAIRPAAETAIGHLKLALPQAPLASFLRAAEIDDHLDRGEDPFACAFDPIRPASKSKFDPVHILAAFRVSAALATVQAANPNHSDPEIILLAVPSDTDLDLYARAATAVFDTQVGHGGPSTCKRGLALWIDRDFGKTALSASFEDLCALIGSGQSVLMITNSASRIPRDILELVDLTLRPAPLTADLICATLALSHSETGYIATQAVRDLLPTADRLRRLSLMTLQRAFSEKTTLDVARALKASASKVTQDARPTLDQVFGQPKLQKAFQSAIADYQNWSQGVQAWKDGTKSFLLYGPPGTGKTLAAEAFAATAGIPLVSGSYAEWQKAGHQGQMLAAMHAAANEAIAKAPCVFFVDEVDSFSSRTHDNQYMRAVVNGLLPVMTDLNKTEGVFVIAATNFRECVDPAIMRPGRLDLHIPVTFLDRTGIEDMLKHRCGALSENPETWSQVIAGMIGMTGAEIDSTIRQAKTMARRDGQVLSPAHLLGACQNTETPDNEFLWRVAVHEAGHVIASIHCAGEIPKKVTVTSKGGEVICTKPNALTESDVVNELTVLMAGRAAEHHVLGAVSTGSGSGPNSDLAKATQLAAKSILQYGFFGNAPTWQELPQPFRLSDMPESGVHKVSKLLDDAAHRAARVCRMHMTEITKLANTLIDRREMPQAEIKETLGIQSDQ